MRLISTGLRQVQNKVLNARLAATLRVGALSFRVGDEERVLKAGEEIAIARGVLHSALNPGDVPALVIWETRPALRTAEFFVAMHRATRGRTRPRLADAAAILSEYSDEFQLAKPSPLIQRIMFSCLAPFGRGAVRPVAG